MGNINSLPVVSQVKSLVQVIAGDEEGARDTQHEFLRKGIIISQLNSLGHSIAGNNAEAEAIQQEFGQNMLSFAENTPIVGHITSGVYAATGDTEKAKQVAIGATKSTVVAAAGVAGLVCGPAAIACGASFALSSNAGWDASDSLISKEKKGMFKQIDNIREGKASVGDIFDFTAGQTLIGAGGALGAKGAQSLAKKGALKCRRKRAIKQDVLFDENLRKLSQHDVNLLPKSFHDIDMSNQALMDPTHLLTTMFTTFVILKLMVLGHPDSKPYYDEICRKNEVIEDCEQNLFEALKKFDKEDSKVATAKTPLDDSLETLLFEMNNMVRNTTTGFNLRSAICLKLDGFMELSACQAFLEKGLEKVKQIFKELYGEHLRNKRTTCNVARPANTFVYGTNFLKHHLVPVSKFKRWYGKVQSLRKASKRDPELAILAEELDNVRPGHPVNTIMADFGNDVHLIEKGINPVNGFPRFETNVPIQIIQKSPGSIQTGFGKVIIELDTGNNVIYHLDFSEIIGDVITLNY